MSATLDKCPKCSAEVATLIQHVGTQFQCATVALEFGGCSEGGPCIKRQRDQLAERVKKLEEIGDLMAAELNRESAPHWEDSMARMWRLERSKGRHADQAEAAACAVIQDERREP